MTDLETRKKLLVIESEAYRELLKGEIRNFRLYGRQTRRRITSLRYYAPAVLLALRVGRSLFIRKRKSTLGQMRNALGLVWKTVLLAAPLLRGFLSRPAPEPAEPAQREYISSRI